MCGLAALMLQSCHMLLVEAPSCGRVLHGPVCGAGHPGPCAQGRNRSRTPTSSHADVFAGLDSRRIRMVLCRELLQTPMPCRAILRLPPPPACVRLSSASVPEDSCCSVVSRREEPGCGAVPAAFPCWGEPLTLTTCHPWQLGILAPPSLAESSHVNKLGVLPAQEFSAWSCSLWWEMPLNLGCFRDRDKPVPDPGPLKHRVAAVVGLAQPLEFQSAWKSLRWRIVSLSSTVRVSIHSIAREGCFCPTSHSIKLLSFLVGTSQTH